MIMKKYFILLVMAVFSASLVAQEEEIMSDEIVDSSYRINLGPKVGVNFSSMSGLSDEFALNPKSSPVSYTHLTLPTIEPV